MNIEQLTRDLRSLVKQANANFTRDMKREGIGGRAFKSRQAKFPDGKTREFVPQFCLSGPGLLDGEFADLEQFVEAAKIILIDSIKSKGAKHVAYFGEPLMLMEEDGLVSMNWAYGSPVEVRIMSYVATDKDDPVLPWLP